MFIVYIIRQCGYKPASCRKFILRHLKCCINYAFHKRSVPLIPFDAERTNLIVHFIINIDVIA